MTSAKDVKELGNAIDLLISSLPGIEATEKDQLDELERLRLEDTKFDEELNETIKHAGNMIFNSRIVFERIELCQNGHH